MSFAAKQNDPSRCVGSVHDSYGVGFHQCLRNWSVVRDGKKYCKQHDPVAVKAKQDASLRAWENRCEIEENRWRKSAIRQASYDEMVELLRDAPKVLHGNEAWHTRLLAVLARAEKGM